jgi:hypothetical protein
VRRWIEDLSTNIDIPSFEEGLLGPSSKMERYRRQGTAGEVRLLSKARQVFDLPRRADPSSKEGISAALGVTSQ